MSDKRNTRRQWCGHVARYAALGGLACLTGDLLLFRRNGTAAANCPQDATTCGNCIQAEGCRLPQVWQIDPDVCIACNKCQTSCVLDESAVKAVNCYSLCGYCDVCTGYFPTKDYVLDTGAENQLCPTGAITRTYVEEKGGVRFFEYAISEKLCIACGKCVVGCRLMNGSLYMQVRHDRCLNCNECAIAVACPAQAFRRVPAASPQLSTRSALAAQAAQARKRDANKSNRRAEET